jgi:hypothetical protein
MLEFIGGISSFSYSHSYAFPTCSYNICYSLHISLKSTSSCAHAASRIIDILNITTGIISVLQLARFAAVNLRICSRFC